MAQTLQPPHPPVALHGVAAPPSRLFQQFPLCHRGVAATPPRALSRPIPDPPVALIWLLGGGSVALPPARGVARSLDLQNPVVLQGWSSYTCERVTL